MWKELNLWYLKNARKLPWRDTKDPYKIWLSEVILQQTRVEQGLPYFEKFIDHYPTLQSLAKAKQEEVMKLWQGLGYYSRAINMHKTAKRIVDELGGKFPDNYDDLLKLKGIGPYTAAAIASIAYNEKCAVIDGNVYRVLARVYGIETPIDTAAGKNLFKKLADEALGEHSPGVHNQAMMELGATICTPKQAECANCPIRLMCYAYKHNAVYAFPVKSKGVAAKQMQIDYLIMVNKDKIWVKKRDDKSIWKNLYEPISLQNMNEVNNVNKQILEKALNVKLQGEPKMIWNTRHMLTHRTIDARFWHVRPLRKPKLPDGAISVTLEELNTLPIHRLFDKFLKSFNLRTLIE